jgi:hypothetical protein
MKNVTLKISKGFSSIVTSADGSHYGAVGTPFGYVVASAHGKHGSLSFIHNGFEHVRVLDGAATPRYLATLAKRFAKEIATSKKAAKKGGR